MSNQLTTKTESFSLTPRSLDEAMKYSEMLARSTIIPKYYQGKAADVLIAVQMGQELGLKPIQALQNIAVINGKPSIYGDACIALVKSHPAFEDIKEYFDDTTDTAHCEIKRKGQSWHKTSFSRKDAEKASLWGKQGPWTQYPKRMLQMRARGFNLRDSFPDALQGLIFAEEAQDYPVENVTPPNQSKAEMLANQLLSKVEAVEPINIEVAQVESRDFFEMVEELKELIVQKEIPGETVMKWLEKANAGCFEEMADDAIAKCLEYVKGK